MNFPESIGPHEGRELELMLKGKKKAALFSDVIPENGIIPEEIIPESAFAPYLKTGKIIRFSEDVFEKRVNKNIRKVAFTVAGEEWRAHVLFWLRHFNDVESDMITGRLLGYSEEEIHVFIDQKKLRG